MTALPPDVLPIHRAALRSKAFWLFAMLWILSAVTVILGSLSSNSISGIAVAFVLIGYEAVLILLTLVLTPAAPLTTAANDVERRIVYVQLAFIGSIILLTGYEGLLFHQKAAYKLPLWSQLIDGLHQVGEQLFGTGSYLVNPVSLFVLPLIGLLLLRAKWRELGLGRGQFVRQTTLLWCVVPLVVIFLIMVSRQVSVSVITTSVLANAAQNGFFEEFLFRGALQSRLRKLISPSWAIVISALIFGLWHLGLGLVNGGSLPGALALLITFQSFSGIAFGVIFERTRNLVAPSVFHVVANVTAQLLIRFVVPQ